MTKNRAIRAVHRSHGILQGETADYVFSMSATVSGQNTWLRFNQNFKKIASAAHPLKRAEEMGHTSPQCELTKAVRDDHAQRVALLDLYRVQLASYDDIKPIFVSYEGQLQIENTQQNSMPLDSHSELQQQNSTCQFDM